MANMIRAEVTGLAEIVEALKQLSDQTAKRLLASATSAAATPILAQAKANLYATTPQIHKRTGTLERSFYKMRIKKVPEHTAMYIVGVRQGKKQQALTRFGTYAGAGTGRDAFYWWWLEFGKKGRPGTPFLAPALPMKRNEAVEGFRVHIRDGINKVVAKYGGTLL